ncbi:DUF6090 family protein [Robiginitalea sp. IMCC44478]|uniref:DUF6090 family protein n=1 Tax=Robiginitalea sp. IMCC44478 TaxID=3459122 RepID=UPI004041EB24
MIRFLSRIRKKLLADNKFSKYLFYVISEIIIVIIGILLALQVDNWNEGRLNREEARISYSNTRQQLLEDSRNIQGQINYNSRYTEQFQYAKKLIRNNARSLKDSLSAITSRLVDYSDFDRQGTIYQTLVSSGEIKLMKSEDIKKRLRALEETYIYVNRMETIHYNAIAEMIPELITAVNLDTHLAINEDKLYISSFENYFTIALRIILEKDQVYHRALEEIEELIALIDQEIS